MGRVRGTRLSVEQQVQPRTPWRRGESPTDTGRALGCVVAVFAGLAVVLAAVGIYSLMAHSVSQRTSEFGIRIALGATTSDVYTLVFKEGLVMSLLGTAIGTAGAFWITRLLDSELYGVTATDPLTFAASVVGLVGVAVLACYVPARRATRADSQKRTSSARGPDDGHGSP